MSEQDRISIDDDWLEVESAASVISFDTLSRPATPSPQSTPQDVTATTTDPVESHHDDHVKATFQLPLHLKNDEDLSLATSEKRQPEAVPPDQEPVKRDDPESFEPSTNPEEFYKACQNATEALAVVARQAHELGGARISTMSLLCSTCKQLLQQTKELEKILEVYAENWASKGAITSFVDIPLNPDIWGLISELNAQLLRAQSELCSLVPPEDDTSPLLAKNIPLRVNMALARCLESFEDTHELFTEFLPILKTDFNEFKTQHMAFPPAEHSDSTKQPRRQPPHPSVVRIRRELYDMKDQFVMINVFLSGLKNTYPSLKLIDPLIFKSLRYIVEVISTLLTNNPSEWIDSDMAFSSPGTISYPQFLTLDPDVLHDVTPHLQGFQEELDITSDQGNCYYSPEMIRNHQEVLLFEGGQLQELRSVIEFTESLLTSQ
ncbi:hypothetical protein FGRMN_5746 [Fusarium graminum]|nr:hypothetical protein FGRMN_5746 [Fusarium graminum]